MVALGSMFLSFVEAKFLPMQTRINASVTESQQLPYITVGWRIYYVS